jgi:DNA-binding transcriptional ArsR family regulator
MGGRARQKSALETPLDSFRRLANYRHMNTVFKALSDPTRRRVLELLRQRPMTAGELADQFPVAKATMSAHFAILREADLVQSDKAGKQVIYRLKMSVLEEALLGFAGVFGLALSRGGEDATPHDLADPEGIAK